MNIEQQSSWRPINAERVSKHTKTTQKPTPKPLMRKRVKEKQNVACTRHRQRKRQRRH